MCAGLFVAFEMRFSAAAFGAAITGFWNFEALAFELHEARAWWQVSRV